MDEKVLNEIQNLGDDDLLVLYHKIMEHLDYLRSCLIDTSVDIEGGEIVNEQYRYMFYCKINGSRS